MIKLLVLMGAVIGFGFFVMYSKRILVYIGEWSDKSNAVFFRMLGKRIRKWNTDIERISSVRSKSLWARLNNYFKDIIVNLDMVKDGVTPIGMIVFILALSFSSSLGYVLWSGDVALGFFAFFAVAYFIIVVLRFFSLVKYEKREAMVMDTEDLISMDIKGGVYNAIVRYRKSFHPGIRPYFEDFIDNIQNKGYSFRDSMLILNGHLGSTFNSFTQKSIQYEAKADNEMADIFSTVVESNRVRRDLRERNNRRFNELRLQFLVSMVIITVYGIFSMYTDDFLREFFTEKFLGKLLILLDLVIITAVLGYLSSIKSKFIG